MDTQQRKAPWPDDYGTAIHEGDRIRHPSGESGIVVVVAGDPIDPWRVDGGDGSLSGLVLRLGVMGRAEVVGS